MVDVSSVLSSERPWRGGRCFRRSGLSGVSYILNGVRRVPIRWHTTLQSTWTSHLLLSPQIVLLVFYSVEVVN